MWKYVQILFGCVFFCYINLQRYIILNKSPFKILPAQDILKCYNIYMCVLIKFGLIINLVQYLTQNNVLQKMELLKVKWKEELKYTQTGHKICHCASVPQCTCCKLDMAWFSISAFIHLADLDLQLWEKILL